MLNHRSLNPYLMWPRDTHGVDAMLCCPHLHTIISQVNPAERVCDT